jgi:lipopolysaccharide/colanic/teichoic acid biosynthesis glycosyltransferase
MRQQMAISPRLFAQPDISPRTDGGAHRPNWSSVTKRPMECPHRILDVMISLILLLLALPFLPLVCLLIKSGSRGPVFYR